MTTTENVPIVLSLNASHPLGDAVTLYITSVPSHGSLYQLDQVDSVGDNESGLFTHYPKLGDVITMPDTVRNALVMDSTVIENMENWVALAGTRLVYVPNVDYSGTDSFSYSATSTNYGEMSQQQRAVHL